MKIRKYRHADCGQMAKLFYDTVHTVCAEDYTEEQLDAWATGEVDLAQWDKSFSEHLTLVAEMDGIIVGFGDMDREGYLDRLYVHKDYQRKGIASAICSRLERTAASTVVTTHASITARAFFEKRGYSTVKKQTVIRKGIALANFIMKKQQNKQ